MSEESYLYGAIIGESGLVRDPQGRGLYRRNLAAIQALPEGSGAALTRGIFAVPDGDRNPAYYRVQVIHFGASYNHLSDRWEDWLLQFEELLRTLYWSKAYLHLEMEPIGQRSYRWTAEDVFQLHSEDPAPTTRWTFAGDERKFEF